MESKSIKKPFVEHDEADLESLAELAELAKAAEPDEPDDDDTSMCSDELPVVKKLTKEEEEAVAVMYYKYHLSITDFCKVMGFSRDKFYSIIKKAGTKAGVVDYRKLSNLVLCSRCTKRAKRVEVASQLDEEW